MGLGASRTRFSKHPGVGSRHTSSSDRHPSRLGPASSDRARFPRKTETVPSGERSCSVKSENRRRYGPEPRFRPRTSAWETRNLTGKGESWQFYPTGRRRYPLGIRGLHFHWKNHGGQPQNGMPSATYRDPDSKQPRNRASPIPRFSRGNGDNVDGIPVLPLRSKD